MTRAGFIAYLRHGLRGLPQTTIDEVVADYEAHFADGLAEGRSEDEVARALGDPVRLARELRAETQFRRYEQSPNASGAAGAIAAFIGLGALDIILLLWVLLPLCGLLIGWLVVGIVGFFVGLSFMIGGPFLGLPGGPFAAVLGGIGLMAASVASLALLTLLSVGIVHLLVWYGRLHFKVLKPAISPEGGAQ